MRQPATLQEAATSLRVRVARRCSLLVGAGDSYAASLCASGLSPLGLVAVDPLDLAERPSLAEKRDVYFISVSGKTRSNVDAARKVRESCRRTVAVTCDPESPLGEECDEVAAIPFSPSAKSPGVLSFSLSLLAVLQLGSCYSPCDFKSSMSEARRNAILIKPAEAGTSYFLGLGALYGVSLYAAAKVYEFTGRSAHAERLEEFSHMELFSLTAADSVNIFSTSSNRVTTEKLHNALSAAGFTSAVLPNRGRSGTECVFTAAFMAQLSALHAAERAGLRQPYFLRAPDKLRISDLMIY